MKTNQIVLGTAQLGLDYGLSNKTGKPSYNDALKIVSKAWNLGIREFDTAQAYGDSEIVLGKIFKELDITSEVKVVTKIDPNINILDSVHILSSIEESLERLGCDQLNGVMLHREQSIELWDDKFSDVIESLINRKLVRNIGVSVYSPEFAIRALNISQINIIQIPFNILDQRFRKTGVFEMAKDLQKIIYTRSLFLQGLLLMKVEEIPDNMSFAITWIKEIELLSKKLGLSRLELAIGYAKQSINSKTRVLFGALNPDQVEQNIKIWNREYSVDLVEIVEKKFSEVEEYVVNPHLWPEI